MDERVSVGLKELRKFGLTLGAVFGFWGAVLIWKRHLVGPYLAALSPLFLSMAWLAPSLLKPVRKVWMAVGRVLGEAMTRAVLALLFYFVIAPIGLLVRCLGKDFLDRKFKENKPSYWHERNVKSNYEKQY